MDLLAAQQWAYIPEVPDEITPARDLLLSYSGILPDDIDNHILRIREDAWSVSRFPCFGRWKFLGLADTSDPLHQQVLFRLRLAQSRDAILDLGCCVGQVLRQFKADGVDGSQLYGTDIYSKFIKIGYDLFRDQDTLGAKFVVGDMLDPSDKRLAQLRGKVTIVYAGSFFHLFSWIQQLYIGKRLVEFLKPGTRNGLIYGRQVGSIGDGLCAATSGASVFLHSRDSFQKLWDEVGKLTKTKWRVEVQEVNDYFSSASGFGKDGRLVQFAVYQIY